MIVSSLPCTVIGDVVAKPWANGMVVTGFASLNRQQHKAGFKALLSTC